MLTLPQRAYTVAGFVIALDIATKQLLIDTLDKPIAVLSFFNLVKVWNRGISFGLLKDLQDTAPYILSAIALIICLVLARWLRRTTTRWEAIAIGLVLGGAIGNVIDRLRFGAVFDFIDIYYKDWHFPAFNIADSAISIGVFMLVLGGLRKPA